jgi:hypothetical protein
MCNFSELKGKTLSGVEGCEQYSGSILLYCDDGSTYKMNHEQNCCECVRIEEVIGDVADIIGAQIIKAEEESNKEDTPPLHVSCTWTFYTIRTTNGDLTIRWLGSSNGYYSESVDFCRMRPPIDGLIWCIGGTSGYIQAQDDGLIRLRFGKLDEIGDIRTIIACVPDAYFAEAVEAATRKGYL